MVTKNCSIKWLENYFSDEQKQKYAEAAAHFHLKAAKIAQIIIILRTFVLENLISVLLDILSIFICSITGFRAIDYPFGHPPLCQHATFILIYCTKYVNTYTGKSFCWHKRGGGGERERYAIKLFLISICFIVKKNRFCPKLSPCSILNSKTFLWKL